jgi:hypothetical protein
MDEHPKEPSFIVKPRESLFVSTKAQHQYHICSVLKIYAYICTSGMSEVVYNEECWYPIEMSKINPLLYFLP